MELTIDLTDEYGEVEAVDDADGLLTITVETEASGKLTIFMNRELFERIVAAGEDLA